MPLERVKPEGGPGLRWLNSNLASSPGLPAGRARYPKRRAHLGQRHVKATAEKEHTLLGSAIHENQRYEHLPPRQALRAALGRARRREPARGLARAHGAAQPARGRLSGADPCSSTRSTARSTALPCVARIEDLRARRRTSIVVATPPATVPGHRRERRRARASRGGDRRPAGLGHGAGSLAEAARLEARRHGLRLVGPNCLGVHGARRRSSTRASRRAAPTPGDLALISQSGAVAAGLVEWAAQRHVGFSGVVSLGDKVDVDFGDCLDYFAADRGTRAILLYIEAISDARKFMSAARAAARAKPVVVIKSGRHAQGARAAATHTGALAGSDAVYDAAFRRAGLLRVFDLDELFAAAETLGRQKPFPGKRLAILTNGGGVGVLAVDRLIDLGGTLAALSPDDGREARPRCCRRPGRAPTRSTSSATPMRAATPRRSRRCSPTSENDAVLVLNVPTALASASQAARGGRRDRQARPRRRASRRKPVFAVWLGEDEASKRAFESVGIPHFATEADAVRGFMHLVRYREAQDLLMETPDSLPRDFAPDAATARADRRRRAAGGPRMARPARGQPRCSRAYDIPVAPVTLAETPDEAAAAARPILAEGGTVAVKILSPDIVHKSDIGGVKLDLTSEEAVRKAARDIFERAERLKPGARVAGVTVQPMVRRPKARELIAGPRRRSDLRPGGGVRARRHRGRGHQRQGAGAAAARSEARRDADRAHAGVAHPQGLPRRAGGRRARDRARARQAVAACRRRAGDPRARHQSVPCRRERRHRGRRAGAGRGRDGSAAGLRPFALRGAALSEGVGAQPRAAGRPARSSCARCGPEDEALFLRVPQACQRRGPASALLRADARVQPCLPRAADPDRLRARHRLRRARRRRQAR